MRVRVFLSVSSSSLFCCSLFFLFVLPSLHFFFVDVCLCWVLSFSLIFRADFRVFADKLMDNKCVLLLFYAFVARRRAKRQFSMIRLSSFLLFLFYVLVFSLSFLINGVFRRPNLLFDLWTSKLKTTIIFYDRTT